MSTLPVFETLQLDREDGIATLWLNRPDSRNALNLRMCHEITAACEALEEDQAVRVVVLRAAARRFAPART